MNLYKKSHLLFTVMFVILFIQGCMTSQFSMKQSLDLTNKFESITVLPEYTYYFSGAKAAPDAVLGIRKEYSIKTDLWKPINVDENQLKEWSIMLGTHIHPKLKIPYYASYIYDENGNEIGIWYAYTQWATIKKMGDNKFNVYPPLQRRIAKNNINTSIN